MLKSTFFLTIAYLIVWLHKYLIIFTKGYKKHDRCDIFKAVYPFSSLWSLASHIHHSVSKIQKDKETKIQKL